MAVSNYTYANIWDSHGDLVYSATAASPKDSNGNYMQGNWDDPGPASQGNAQWSNPPVDTLGRTPVTITEDCNNVTTETCYDVLNSQGTTSRYIANWESIPVSTAFGATYTTEYSGNIWVIQNFQLPDGESYNFSYDSGSTSGHYGELTAMTLPTGGQVTYSYGNFVDYGDVVNRWIASETEAGGTWTYTPSLGGSCSSPFTYCNQVIVKKPSTDQITYTFGVSGLGAWDAEEQYASSTGATLETISITWDTSAQVKADQTLTYPVPSGSISSTTEYTNYCNAAPGQISEWKFYTGSLPSAADRVTTVTFTGYPTANITCLPSVITVQSGSTTVAQTSITYDSPGPVGVTGVKQHDDQDYGTGDTSRGNPSVISKMIDGSSTATTTLTYDTSGQIVSVTDPDGHTIGFSYADNFFTDNGGCLPSLLSAPGPTNAYLTGATLPVSGSISFGYYYGSGKRAFRTDQNGAATCSHFEDPEDRPTDVNTNFSGGGWQHAAYPSATETDVYTGIQSTSWSGCNSCREVEGLLDEWGRPSTGYLVSDPDGSTRVDTSYDLDGHAQTVTNPYRSTSDTTYGMTITAYDALDRPTQTTRPDGSLEHIYYGPDVSNTGGAASQLCASGTYGYPILTIDAAGDKRETWTDGFGRTIETDEPDSSGNLTQATCYAYDGNNKLTQVVSPGGQTRTYAYDDLGRLTSSTTPEGGNVSYIYDADGNLLSRTAPKPNQINSGTTITTAYSYDPLNRLTGISYSDGSPSITYYYDQSSYNGLSIGYGLGRRMGMSDASGETAWSYDAAGRILTERKTIAGVTKTVGYTYNLDGSLASLTYPDGHVVNYTYNKTPSGPQRQMTPQA